MLLLLACSGDAPWASIDVQRDAPVELDRSLYAYFLETSPARSGQGDGLLVLVPEPVDCDEVDAAGRIVFDESHPLFSWEGLAFYLSFETGDGAEELAWEDLYWGDEATGIIGERSMSAWLMTAGSLLALDGGWLRLDEHSNELVAGSFEVRWYAGAFAAEHCGVRVAGDDEVDTGS